MSKADRTVFPEIHPELPQLRDISYNIHVEIVDEIEANMLFDRSPPSTRCFLDISPEREHLKPEQENDGIVEWQNGGKLSKILNTERRKITPKSLKTKRWKLPEILKDRTVETTPNLKKKFKVFLILAFFHNKWGVIVTFPDILD